MSTSHRSTFRFLLRGRRPAVQLAALGPIEQLRAGRLPRRVVQLVAGLWLYGTSMALLIRADLGLDPWDVLHDGLLVQTGLSFGTIVTVVGALVLLLWIPLRQRPGLGTIANVAIIGLATDVGLAWLSTPPTVVLQVLAMVAAVVLNGLAGALYIGAQLGPGPRDGLMTGIARRSGLSIRLVRTCLEITVLAAGFLLGGAVGVATVLYAVSIGPLVQAMLRGVVVPLRTVAPQGPGPARTASM